MKIDYFTKDSELPSTIETAGDGQSYPWIERGVVYDFDDASGEYGPTEFTPAQARAKAAALLQAADEADGRKPGAAERDLLEFIDRAGWDGTAMVSAVVAETRNKVAAELEALPTYNDVADWCAHIGRRQAIETARNGRRQEAGK